MGIIQALMPTIQSLIGTYLEAIRSVIGGVLTAIQGLLNVFAGIFTGDWSRVWEGVKGIFSGVWEVDQRYCTRRAERNYRHYKRVDWRAEQAKNSRLGPRRWRKGYQHSVDSEIRKRHATDT